MNTIASGSSAAESVMAILEGGPATLPEASRTQIVDPLIQKIKVAHYGGYEHFERIPESVSHNEIVFSWTMRTEVAE
jgi:hypothetical protein